MFNTGDLTFVLSGGITNSDPTKSLGGIPSTTGIIPNASNDNLFDDLTDAELQQGLTDYRCFFIFNDNPTDGIINTTISISDQIAGGSVAFIGINRETDIQHVVIRDTTAAPPSMVLSYEGHHFTVVKQLTPTAWAASFQQAINSFGVLSGVTVGPIVSGLQLTFNIHFKGADDLRNHQLLQQVTIDNNVSILKIVEGAPVNFIPDPLLYNTNPPFGVQFTNSTNISLGTLNPGDGVPIWAKRVTLPNTEEQDLDGFSVEINGDIAIGKPVVVQCVLFSTSNITANGSVNRFVFGTAALMAESMLVINGGAAVNLGQDLGQVLAISAHPTMDRVYVSSFTATTILFSTFDKLGNLLGQENYKGLAPFASIKGIAIDTNVNKLFIAGTSFPSNANDGIYYLTLDGAGMPSAVVSAILVFSFAGAFAVALDGMRLFTETASGSSEPLISTLYDGSSQIVLPSATYGVQLFTRGTQIWASGTSSGLTYTDRTSAFTFPLSNYFLSPVCYDPSTDQAYYFDNSSATPSAPHFLHKIGLGTNIDQQLTNIPFFGPLCMAFDPISPAVFIGTNANGSPNASGLYAIYL